MSKPLSPAAQTVLEASHEAWVTKDDPISIAAAALHAAADEIDAPPSILDVPEQQQRWYGLGVANFKRKLLAIAAELEGGNS